MKVLVWFCASFRFLPCPSLPCLFECMHAIMKKNNKKKQVHDLLQKGSEPHRVRPSYSPFVRGCGWCVLHPVKVYIYWIMNQQIRYLFLCLSRVPPSIMEGGQHQVSRGWQDRPMRRHTFFFFDYWFFSRDTPSHHYANTNANERSVREVCKPLPPPFHVHIWSRR